ncbi:MAG TPA: hypothetical protein VNF75_03220 [Candidatus Dormibacteraeota bacterium]|nr:hypothetical protein [Candidatus Dormibacteraeota bacterium]
MPAPAGHLLVGSGAVEAGCRAMVAQRMKLSGMRWSLRGAAAIVSLRCQESNGDARWDQIWKSLHFQTEAA